MIAKKQYFLFVPLSLVLAIASFAQKDPLLKPDPRRELFHDYVDKEQLAALKSDGRADTLFTVSANEEVNFLVTYALVKKIDQLQYKIEKDTVLGGQVKVRYIRGLERLLKDMNGNWKQKRFAIAGLPAMLEAYWNCVETDRKGMSVEKIIDGLHYDIAKPVVNSSAFDANTGFKYSKDLLVKKYCHLYPEQTFSTLRLNTDLSFADSLIKVAAYRYPKQLYDYASANNRLGALIRKIDDPLIKAVSRMATSSGSGQLYFPFLDNIISGKMTIADVDAVRNDSIQYYKLLVKTHLDYVARAINKDTARGYDELNEMLGKKATDVFVNTINGLHDESDAVRFRIIQPLNAQELYYLAVLSDGIIYTSSYTKGVFSLMMSRVNNKGDSLLRLVMFDRYRKFIKMAAGYNTLSAFLASFPDPENASALMRAFVGRLEKTSGLEDGVDVADSYASIAETIRPLADEMLMNIKLNYLRNVSQNNKRGIEIYNILEKLFLSADTTKKIDLTKELGIPPVYEVTNESLQNDSGRVIMQVFFYGEKSDMGIFNSFVSKFRNSNWRIYSDKYWVSATSLKGKPVTVYANRALPQETSEDEAAQKALNEYLSKNKIKPTITIHRGHSYTAPSTIAQMFPSSKIVFLGSCGGYHLIHDVLAKTSDAHITASKQIGMGRINQPFTDLILEELLAGKNIEWIPFWIKFRQRAGDPAGFEDYIPPYKNLGALFIKAYKIAMGETEAGLAAAPVNPPPSSGNQ